MFMLQDTIIPEVANRSLPNLPAAGEVIAKQAIGHLDPLTGVVLLDRLVERSAYGATKFGEAWRARDNCQELCEETTDAVVYGAQETARLELGLTRLEPGSDAAIAAREHLANAVRHAALADHFAQLANAEITGQTLGQK